MAGSYRSIHVKTKTHNWIVSNNYCTDMYSYPQIKDVRNIPYTNIMTWIDLNAENGIKKTDSRA